MGFQDFFRDFKISSEISAKPYEISASGGPLASPFRSEPWLHRESPLPGVTNCRLAQPVSTATEACKQLAVEGSGA